MNKELIIRKESYRIWFEFYKIACESLRGEVTNAIEESSGYYASWGDVIGVKFDDWWISHSHLFEQNYVRQVYPPIGYLSRENILIEVPLNESSSDLIKKIQTLIDNEIKTRGVVLGKNKNKLSGSFQLSEGSEPKLKALREVLNVYRDIHLKNPLIKGKKRYEMVIKYYEKRPKNKRVPHALIDESGVFEDRRAMRNLSRWISWGRQIELNVARGEFPGDYG